MMNRENFLEEGTPSGICSALSLNRVFRRQAVEAAIDLGRVEDGGILGQPVPPTHLARIERAGPVVTVRPEQPTCADAVPTGLPAPISDPPQANSNPVL